MKSWNPKILPCIAPYFSWLDSWSHCGGPWFEPRVILFLSRLKSFFYDLFRDLTLQYSGKSFYNVFFSTSLTFFPVQNNTSGILFIKWHNPKAIYLDHKLIEKRFLCFPVECLEAPGAVSSTSSPQRHILEKKSLPSVNQDCFLCQSLGKRVTLARKCRHWVFGQSDQFLGQGSDVIKCRFVGLVRSYGDF